MPYENSNTQGSKGNNSQWQRAVLILLQQVVAASGGGGSGVALNTAAKGATVIGKPTSRSKSVDVTALDVQIVDVSGNPIVSFGGDATAAKQDTGNTSLASIDSKVPTVGQKTMAASLPVVIASNQSSLPVTLQGTSGAALVRPDQEIRVATDASSLFYDSFETFDTTNRWTAAGTVLPTAALGTLTVSAGTTALATSVLTSQPTFALLGNMFNECLSLIQVDSTLKTGSYRFFGIGVAAGSPTVASPITNGVGFEWIDTTGVLSGVVWSGGVKTLTVSLSTVQPLDSSIHRYQVYFKSSRVYFEIDNVSQGSLAYPNPQVTTLPILSLHVNGGSTVSPAAIFTSGFIGMGDTASNNKTISDGTFPWRKVQVASTGALLISSAGLPTTLGQQAAATSQPVALANEDINDLYITGAAAQTATVNNILPSASGATATDVQMYRSFAIQVASTGTGGTFIFEGSNDNSNFVGVPVFSIASLTPAPVVTAITASSSNIVYIGACPFRYLRLRIATTITGGSIQAFSSISQVPFSAAQLVSILTNPSTTATSIAKSEDSVSASADTGIFTLGVRRDVLFVSTSATGDYNEFAVDTYGSVLVKDQLRHKRTYSIGFSVVAATTPGDIFQLIGSATTSVQVTKIRISGIQTTGGQALVTIQKRSAANTGGTSSGATIVPHISTDAGATAVGAIYTANPTPGTSLGNIRAQYVPIPAVTGSAQPVEFNFAERGKPIVLSGVTQAIAISLGGATLTGSNFAVEVEFTEE